MLIIDWKQEAERLIFDEGISYNKTTEHLMKNHKDFKGLSERKAKDKLRSYIRRTDKYKAKQAENRGGNYTKSVQYNADGSRILEGEGCLDLANGEPITPEIIMKAHNLKPDDWEVVTYKTNFYQAQQKGGGTMMLCQSKITVKPKSKDNGITLETIRTAFETLDRKYKPFDIIKPRQTGLLIAEPNIADLHFGRLCWYGDTGNNYDYKIARDIYLTSISDVYHHLLPLKEKHGIEKIIFPVGNDLVNSDTPTKTTTAGTPQDTDVRWQKLIEKTIEIVVRGIDILKEIAPVEVVYVVSNHDEVTTFGIVMSLYAWYRNDNKVTVDISPLTRKYCLLGKTLVCYAHGCYENPKKGTKNTLSGLAALMPVEAKELWAISEYREIHAAHLHTEQAIEERNGIIVRRISSPVAPDTWSYRTGYVGNVRKIQTFVYDKQRGLIHTINTPVEVSV